MAEFEVVKNELRIKKHLTKLDLFVIDTLKIISKYTEYVVISGYVSIFFGRARATEDVDIFIGDISWENFRKLCEEATSKGYEFNVDNAAELYKEYFWSEIPINLWEKDLPLMRIEMKIAEKSSQKKILREKIKVFYNGGFLYFSPIEYQSVFKRYFLKSDKDLEDARHLEVVFKNLDKGKIESYKNIVLSEGVYE